MNNNKSHDISEQQPAVEAIQLKKKGHVKTNEDLSSSNKETSKKQVELDNPNFVLGYN